MIVSVVLCIAVASIAISVVVLVLSLWSAFTPSHAASIQTVSDNLQTLTDFLSLRPISACGPGNWRRVAYINMTDSSQQCPSAWREYSTPVRSCGRPVTSSASCPSTIFETYGLTYNRVCGRAIGYQFRSPDAFENLLVGLESLTADDNYVDGLSVTYSSNPRQHIWTFAASWAEFERNIYTAGCPCAHPGNSNFGTVPPSYVGSNYFCETGNIIATHAYNTSLYTYPEPLWDGQGCVTSQCCTFNSPPWFSVQLPSPTGDNIEVRMMW